MSVEIIDQHKHRGTSFIVRALVEERPDLLEQCPPELQKAIHLQYEAEALQTNQKFAESLGLLSQVAEILLPDKVKK